MGKGINMSIEQLTRNGAVLEKIVRHSYDGAGSNLISALTFYFKDQGQLTLLADSDTDELTWGAPPDGPLKSVDIEEIFPPIIDVYGLSLAWCWEMKNHQGYFDAVQLELADAALRRSISTRMAQSIGRYN